MIKEAIRRASVDLMVAYPITPQSEAAALIGELYAEGYVADYMRGESEFAVMWPMRRRILSAGLGSLQPPPVRGRCGPLKTSRCG